MKSNASTHPDQRFVEALLANDHQLIQEIYSRYSSEIGTWIQRNNGNADDARDIFQEAILAVTLRARRGNFRLTCPFGAYLFLVVRGKWFNELKRRKQQGVTEQPPAGLVGEEKDALILAEETLLEQERTSLFREKFQHLSDRCRQLIQLSWQGLKMEAVAEQMGITYAYARKKKSECIAKLIASIKDSPAYHQLP